MEFPEHPGTILSFAGDRLLWATYERVGLLSGDGKPVWEHHFDDARWPTLAIADDGLTVVAMDPTMEGDDRPPLVVQFDDVGQVVWETELGGSNLDEDLQWVDLIALDGGVFVQTTDAIYRLNWNTGTQEWRSPLTEADIETFGLVGHVYYQGVLYVADPISEFSGGQFQGAGGQIQGVSAANGQIQMALEVGGGPRVVGVLDGWLVYTDESGVHGVDLASGGTWHQEMAGAQASIEGQSIVVASLNSIAVLTPTGDLESSTPVSQGQPQLPPVLIDQWMLVPGWEGTTAIDLATGEVINEWRGSFYSPVYEIDGRRVLMGVAGDGVYLLQSP